MRGTASDVLGRLLATSRRKTEIAIRMDTPSDTFSPLSAGSRKTIRRPPVPIGETDCLEVIVISPINFGNAVSEISKRKTIRSTPDRRRQGKMM